MLLNVCLTHDDCEPASTTKILVKATINQDRQQAEKT